MPAPAAVPGPASPAAVTPAAHGVLIPLLIRLAVVHLMALYAFILTALHWLRDVPIHQTWAFAALGFVLLFLAIGVMVTGRPLGYFSTPAHRFSVDWLPLLLIWPLGLSIWTCLALGLAGLNAKQQVADGLALPLMLLAATLPPLFLGRMPPWPGQRRFWHLVMDGHYALASLAAALTLAFAMHAALIKAPPLGNPLPQAVSPQTVPMAAVAKPVGFVCDPSKVRLVGDEDDEDNKCPPARRGAATAKPSGPGPGGGTVMVPPIRPIDQNFSPLAGLWMLLSGGLLAGARAIAARRQARGGAAALSTEDLGLGSQLGMTVRSQAVAQAGSWLRSSGIPNADLLADMVGKITQPSPASPPVPDPVAPAATVPSPAPPDPNPAPPPPPAPEPPVSTTPVPPPPAAPEPPPASAAPQTPPAGPDPATIALQGSVEGLTSALTQQQAATGQLQANLGTLQDKLEKQAGMISQMATQSQQSAEESRRTIDGLTRLMQGLKADLDRLARSQTAGS